MALFGTVPALFRPLLLYNFWPAPALALPKVYPVYALVDTGMVRAPATDPATPDAPGTPGTGTARRDQVHPAATAATGGGPPVGLTPVCTRGQTAWACHLAPYPHPILPADRVPATRTSCHPAPAITGQRVQLYPALVYPL